MFNFYKIPINKLNEVAGFTFSDYYNFDEYATIVHNNLNTTYYIEFLEVWDNLISVTKQAV